MRPSWVLSLPGFLVASKVLEECGGMWELPEVKKQEHFDLHRTILTAWTDLRTYDAMVERLAHICEPNTQVFRSFDDVLRRAYSLLADWPMWPVSPDSEEHCPYTHRKRRRIYEVKPNRILCSICTDVSFV